MEQIGTIETACRHPVKSMAGEEMEEAFVGFAGMMGDRTYAFIPAGATTKGFPWQTGRDQDNLVLYRPRYRHAAASVLPMDLSAPFAMTPEVNPVFPGDDAFAVDVNTPGGREPADLATELAEQGGKAVTLRFFERSLYDCRCPCSATPSPERSVIRWASQWTGAGSEPTSTPTGPTASPIARTAWSDAPCSLASGCESRCWSGTRDAR